MADLHTTLNTNATQLHLGPKETPHRSSLRVSPYIRRRTMDTSEFTASVKGTYLTSADHQELHGEEKGAQTTSAVSITFSVKHP